MQQSWLQDQALALELSFKNFVFKKVFIGSLLLESTLSLAGSLMLMWCFESGEILYSREGEALGLFCSLILKGVKLAALYFFFFSLLLRGCRTFLLSDLSLFMLQKV